jgi:hypothetical protein
MKYILTESKLEGLIEKFITKSFPLVYKVYFTKRDKILGSSEGRPTVEETIINIILDNSDNSMNRQDLFKLESEIRNKVDDYFSLDYQKYGSDWGFNFRQLAVVGIFADIPKLNL